jgi:hypothetical protein
MQIETGQEASREKRLKSNWIASSQQLMDENDEAMILAAPFELKAFHWLWIWPAQIGMSIKKRYERSSPCHGARTELGILRLFGMTYAAISGPNTFVSNMAWIRLGEIQYGPWSSSVIFQMKGVQIRHLVDHEMASRCSRVLWFELPNLNFFACSFHSCMRSIYFARGSSVCQYDQTIISHSDLSQSMVSRPCQLIHVSRNYQAFVAHSYVTNCRIWSGRIQTTNTRRLQKTGLAPRHQKAELIRELGPCSLLLAPIMYFIRLSLVHFRPALNYPMTNMTWIFIAQWSAAISNKSWDLEAANKHSHCSATQKRNAFHVVQNYATNWLRLLFSLIQCCLPCPDKEWPSFEISD